MTTGIALSSIVEKVHLVAGVVLNLMLLYLIRKFTKLNLGAYKQLLTIFTTFDLFLIIMHGMNNPKVVVSGRIFGVVTHSFVENRQITAFHCTCFTVPFVLMNIHFLYRYWTVRSSHLILLFTRPSFVLLLVGTTLIAGALWHVHFKILFKISKFRVTIGIISRHLLTLWGPEGQGEAVEVLRAIYERDSGVRIEDGWCVMDYASEVNGTRFAIILSLFDAVMILSFLNALTLGALTYAGIRDAKTISSHYRTLQFKLLTAVTAQTLVPLIFVYIPYFFSVTLPYFDVPAGGIGGVCMLMTACFPAWDAVIIISLMTDYREAVLRLIRGKTTTTPIEANTTAIEGRIVTY